MRFINTTGNTIRLSDIEKNIPFLDNEQPQEISTNEVKKSKTFQSLCLSNQFKILLANNEQIEQNLYRIQNNLLQSVEDRIEVMVRGHFYTNSGYGKANRNLVYALGRSGIRVGIETSSENISSLNQMEIEKITRFRRILPNAICIDSMIPSFGGKADYRYRILNTTIEASSIPQQFVTACNSYNEIWVVSDFCKNILEQYDVNKPIYVIPNAVDIQLYNLNAKPHILKPDLKEFIFISIVSWSYRKGYDILLKSYLEEFSNQDNVTLLIVTPYKNRQDDETDKYIKSVISGKHNHAQIARIGKEIPEFEMPRIYRACNCFVSCSRGEGFSLPIVEAGLCGLPVIATNHSGHTMFLNMDNSYLVDVDKISVIPDGTTGIHYWDNQLFPELKDDKVIRDFGECMRCVYTDYNSAKEKNNRLLQNLSTYSLEQVGQKALSRLKIIWEEIKNG